MTSRILNRLVLMLALILCSSPVFALNSGKTISQHIQTVWTTKQGMPTDNLTDMIQGHKGYILIGSYEGLIRFDGSKFSTISKYSHPDFASNSVRVVIEDEDGTLWLGTNGNGLARFQDGKFSMFTTADGLPGNAIRSMCIGATGELWLGTSAGLASIKLGKITPYNHVPELGDDLVEMVYKDKDNTIWIGTNSGGLVVFKDNEFKPYKENKQVEKNIFITMGEGNNGNKWLGTRDDGAFMIGADGSLKRFTSKNGFPASTVTSILKARDGGIWFGTDSGIVRLLDEEFESYSEKQGLNNDLVTKLIEDTEGNLWAATGRGGLAKFSDGKFLTYSTEDGLIHKKVNAICGDSANGTWIGTDSGLGLLKEGKFIDHPAIKFLGNSRIRQIVRDRDGVVWFSTYSNLGVVALDGKTIKSFSKKQGLSQNRCRITYKDSHGNVWIGTTSGLNRIAPDGSIKIFRRADGLKNEYIMCILEDSAKRLWVGTDGGGVHVLVNGRFKAYTTDHGLAGNIIFKVFEDSSKNIWVTTNEGINRFENGSFSTVTVKNGLFHDAVFQIVEDSSKTFWMTSSKGVFTVKQKSIAQVAANGKGHFNILRYTESDGFKAGITPVSWATIDRFGQIWFPTLDGVAVINPINISKNLMPSPVYVESVVADDRQYSLYKVPAFPRGSKRVVFGYTALSYVVPENVVFQYMLEGFDNDWCEPTNKREATYTNLPPGDYTFKVKAANNDGVWSLRPGLINIKQRAYFYEIKSIQALILMGLGVFIYLMWTVRTKKMKARQKELTVLVDNKTSELRGAYDKLQKVYTEVDDANNKTMESIRYARLIQRAIMPEVDEFVSKVPNSFSIWLVRDIIGGDIIFAELLRRGIMGGVIDCTGHGIPGALLSMVATSGLRSIVIGEGKRDPGKILDNLNIFVRKILQQDRDQGQSDDGMDAALCYFDIQRKVLMFSSAVIPLFYIKNGEACVIKGDKASIGSRVRGDNGDEGFVTHEIRVEKGMCFYMASDGLLELTGGPKGLQFGKKRFKKLIADIHNEPFALQKKLLMKAFNEYTENHEMLDDVTVMGFNLDNYFD